MSTVILTFSSSITPHGIYKRFISSPIWSKRPLEYEKLLSWNRHPDLLSLRQDIYKGVRSFLNKEFNFNIKFKFALINGISHRSVDVLTIFDIKFNQNNYFTWATMVTDKDIHVFICFHETAKFLTNTHTHTHIYIYIYSQHIYAKYCFPANTL